MPKIILQIGCIIIIFNSFSIPVLGQIPVKGKVTGTIIEQSTGETMEFVTVLLFEQAAENYIEGTTTDKNGAFAIPGIPAGQYYLQISFIGFETTNTSVFAISAERPQVEVNEIAIAISNNLLEDVEVVAEKSPYNLAIDRKIYNVEKDIMSLTSSAAEILQNIPSVTVDIDGQVSLRGTSNITFFINGKPSALMRANSAAALQSIPANTIERIEVITNPSAKYKPDGAGGIINIVMKKEKRQGWNATLIANGGNLERYNANLTMNYNAGSANIYGSYGFRHKNTPRKKIETRTNKQPDGTVISNFEDEISSQKEDFSHVITAGIDYAIHKKTQFSLSGEFYTGNDQSLSLSNSRFEEVLEGYTTAFSIDRTLDEREEEYEISAVLEHEFEKEDHNLSVEFIYANYDEKEDNEYDTRYTLPSFANSRNQNLIEKGGPLAELAVEYAYPIGEETNLEAGYVGEFLTDDIRFLLQDFDFDNNSYVTDLTKSNHFVFRQNVHALYTTIGHSIGDFSFLAGLRAEQANVTSDLKTTDIQIPNNYFKIYPTLHLAYEWGEHHEMQLNYSKRINRADSDEHNPFAEYDDPRSREAGNPQLKPEQIHSLELGYRYQKDNFSFIPSLYYRYKFDAFTEIEELVEDSILQTTFQNLSDESSAGLELVFTANIKDAVNLILSSNAYHHQINASNLGYSENKSIFSWNTNLALNINMTRSTYLQLNSYYRSARLTTQGKRKPRFLINFGMRQDILKTKASLTLTVSDVFNTLNYERFVDTPELSRRTIQERNTQIIYLGFVYRFGKSSKKKAADLDFEDKI